MKMFSRKIRIPIFILISIILLIIVCFILIAFLNTESNQHHLSAILGGLFTGGLIAILQLFLNWYEYRVIDKFKRMKVIDIRSNRDDRAFYSELINESKSKIEIMGVTANRFISHFADEDSGREETKALIRAMNRGVQVKLLVPEIEYLENERQKDDAKHTGKIFITLANKYSPNFKYKYFSHQATHSIFVIDDICILGPVFPGVSSKDTPAIQLQKGSPYAEKYLNYFSDEWDKAKDNES